MSITIKQLEAKTLKFTVSDNDGVLDLSEATLSFGMKHRKTDTAYVIEKAAADFNKDDAATGIATLALSASDLDLDAGKYYAELQTAFVAGGVDKSDDIIIRIEKSVIG